MPHPLRRREFPDDKIESSDAILIKLTDKSNTFEIFFFIMALPFDCHSYSASRPC
jgi:hypothetical protein